MSTTTTTATRSTVATATIWFRDNPQPQVMQVHHWLSFWRWLYGARQEGLVTNWSLCRENQ